MSSSLPAVLLIDDDRCIRQLLTLYLERNGFEVSAAVDGYEAKSLVDCHKYNGIILDMMMPRVDGMQFLDWLRNEKSLDIPVVVLTGIGGEKRKSEMLAAGASKVFSKPVKPRELVKSLQEHFD